MTFPVFIQQIPSDAAQSIEALVAEAPGVISTEVLHDKNTSQELGAIFCHLQDGAFEKFKQFLEASPSWMPEIIIQEGSTL